MNDQNEKNEEIEACEDSDAPLTCEELMEDYILLEDAVEVEPEEEPEEVASRTKREEVELRFARFERNYRSRRIRELTLTPFKKKGNRGRPRQIQV